MNEAVEAAQGMPGWAWVVIVLFFGGLIYRIVQSKKNTGSYVGGIIPGGSPKRPPTHHN